MVNEAQATTTLFGSSIIGIGIMSYLKLRNPQHLFFGTFIGGAYVIAGAMIDSGRNVFEGHLVGASASAVILTTGMKRMFATKQPFPGLAIVSLGLFCVQYHLSRASATSALRNAQKSTTIEPVSEPKPP